MLFRKCASRTRAVINNHEQPDWCFAKNADWQFPLESTERLISDSVGGKVDFVNATKLATALMGDSINQFIHAWFCLPERRDSFVRSGFIARDPN